MHKDFCIKESNDGIMEPQLTCSICGSVFSIIDRHYISRENTVTGLTVVARKDEPKLYDTFDCPVCGCQNRIQERKYRYAPWSYEDEEEDKYGEDE